MTNVWALLRLPPDILAELGGYPIRAAQALTAALTHQPPPQQVPR